MRLQARRIDDGTGPYRWRPVVLEGTQLALGGMYDKPDKLAECDAETIAEQFASVGYEVRLAPVEVVV